MPQTFFSNASQDVHSPLPGVPTAKVRLFFEIHKQINTFNTKKTCYPHGQHAPTNNK